MHSLADRIERAAPALAREAKAPEAAMSVLKALVNALRTDEPTTPRLDLEALRSLRTPVLDAILPDATGPEVRRVADWLSGAIELRLAETSDQLTAMLDAIDDRLILLDVSPEARVIFLNRASESAALGMHGVSRDGMVGRSTIAGTRSPDYERYVASLVARARAGETVGGEFLLPLADGALWHEHRFHPVRSDAGEVEAVAVSSREIHARKLAEDRLHLLSKVGLLAESRELDDLLARAAGLAVPELADWSLFELVKDGVIQRSTVVHPDIARRVDVESQTGVRRGSPCVDVGIEARVLDLRATKRGRTEDAALVALLEAFGASTAIVVPFVVMGAPIAVATFVYGAESGRRHGAADLAIANEVARRASQIVENAHLHAEVAQALAYRERVMGILGHDLRNPVAAVLSLATTLAQRADVPDRTKEGLRHIHSAGARMEKMIATLLDFTRLRFDGTLVLARESFDLQALVRRVVDELVGADPAREIGIEATGDLRGRWDVSRIGQVVSNLIGNALAHGTRGRVVRVALAATEDDVTLIVANDGAIPGEAHAKLFEPFWQGAEASRSRGLGLGLWIVRQVVEAHGGEVTVRSEDDVTTFAVRLPR